MEIYKCGLHMNCKITLVKQYSTTILKQESDA